MQDEQERPSRSQRKREHHALIGLARALSGLSPKARQSLGLNDALQQAVQDAATMKATGARERQFRYIANLLDKTDHAALQQTLNNQQKPSKADTALQHQAEAWRERLLQEGTAALESLVAEYPATDRARIHTLLEEARAQATHHKPPKAARLLFRYLRELLAAE